MECLTQKGEIMKLPVRLKILRLLHSLDIFSPGNRHQVLSTEENILLAMIASEALSCKSQVLSRDKCLESICFILELRLEWDKIPEESWTQYAYSTGKISAMRANINLSQLAKTPEISELFMFMPPDNQMSMHEWYK